MESSPLKSRGSVNWPLVPQSGQAISAKPPSGARPFFSSKASINWSARSRWWHCLHSVSGIDKRVDVTTGPPHVWGEDNRGVQTDNVIAAANHSLPPLTADVLLEFHAKGSVVPGGTGTPVDLAAREHQAPTLGKVNDVLDAIGHDAPLRLAVGRTRRGVGGPIQGSDSADARAQ